MCKLYFQAWPKTDEEQITMKRNLVSVNEVSQQEALKMLYSRDLAEGRKQKIAKMRRIVLVYNPGVCIWLVCVYKLVCRAQAV